MSKDAGLSLRLSVDEKTAIQQKADCAGLSLSEFATKACMEHPIVILEEGRAIAATLHQILRLLQNSQDVPSGDNEKLAEIIEALCAVTDKLTAIEERRPANGDHLGLQDTD